MYREVEEQQESRAPKENILKYIFSYFRLRLRQISVLRNLIFEQFVKLGGSLKSLVIRNMYWGRTSFYKSAFHAFVIGLTIIALSSGLGLRISEANQVRALESVNVRAGFTVNSDIIYQQGALFPASELDQTESLFQNYKVKEGDSLSKIADEYEVSENSIRWANNIPSGRDTLRVGQNIKIPAVNGVLYTVKDDDTVDKILSKVELKDQKSDKLTFLELNAEMIDADGKPIPGKQVLIADATLKQPKPRPTVNRPTPRPSPTPSYNPQPQPSTGGGSARFVNPMQQAGSYRFSRGYYAWHRGVDLGVSPGNWIVAAGSGRVMRAGWCGLLGYCVSIDHGNGYQTIYGHGNGVLGVRAGQQVSAGQRILQSGCTGNCFGPHVHISITSGGSDVYGCIACRINPAGIIPY